MSQRKRTILDKARAKEVEAEIGQRLSLTQYLKENKLGPVVNQRVSCPFHEDATPSMFVDEERNIFKCFSCQRGGGVISFHQHMKKLNYYEAMDDLMKGTPGYKRVLRAPEETTDMFTEPVKVRPRFSLKNAPVTGMTLKQVVRAVKQRGNTEEVLAFVNDCMNEMEEHRLVSKYRNAQETGEVLADMSLEDLML